MLSSQSISNLDPLLPNRGNRYGNVYINGPATVQLGDQVGYQQQGDLDLGEDDEKGLDKLRKSLVFDRMESREQNIKSPLLSTCQWLVAHPNFQAWWHSYRLQNQDNFLWIKGKPGCGKSTLMKATLEWIQRQNMHGTVVAYFFNARAHLSIEKSSLGMYRMLVHKLIQDSSAVKALFKHTFQNKKPGLSGDDWTKVELQNFLIRVVRQLERFRLCLFLDALDEAEYDDDVRDMIQFLSQLSDHSDSVRSCHIQICLSSRHYPHITIDRGLALVVEDQPQQAQDIERYISEQLRSSNSSEADHLKSQILARSGRIFLWVVLVIHILNTLDEQGAPLSEMQSHLDSIPSGLNNLFCEILMKNSHGIENSILVFQWMLFSQEPLPLDDLYMAIEFSKSPAQNAWVLPTHAAIPELARLKRFFLNCSRGLVEVTHSDQDKLVGKPPEVQFIHETVREFLLGQQGLASVAPALSTNLVGISHAVLQLACSRCIAHHESLRLSMTLSGESFQTRHTWHVQNIPPFLKYATHHIFEHLAHVHKHSPSQSSSPLPYTDREGRVAGEFRYWWNSIQEEIAKKTERNPSWPGIETEEREITHEMTLLYFLVRENYFHDVPSLLVPLQGINAICGRFGTALQAAAKHGHLLTVKLLLDMGAEVGIIAGEYGNAVHAAAAGGHVDVVGLLLQRCNSIQRTTFSGGAIYLASDRGHLPLVQSLVSQGADINVHTGRYGSPLQAACYRNHYEVANHLILSGADIDASGGNFGNALQAACTEPLDTLIVGVRTYAFHTTIAELLIENGADVNARGGQYGTALIAAAESGHYRVVKVLIQHGVDINAQGPGFDPVLYCLCRNGSVFDLQVVRLLLENGANVNARGIRGDTALLAHIDQKIGYVDLVELLLKHGADVNATDRRGRNALQVARDKRSGAPVVSLLQKYSAKQNVQLTS